MNISNISKFCISKSFYFLGHLVGLLLNLILLLKKQSIVIIREDRIGHQVGTLDSELYKACKRKKEFNQNTIFLMIENIDNVANKYFRRIAPEIIKRFGFNYKIMKFNSNYNLTQRFLKSYLKEGKRFYRSSITDTPHLKISILDKNLISEDILDKLELKKEKYVCLYCRDSKYLDERFPGTNWTYHNHRNSKIDNMAKLARYITNDLQMEVVRVGSNVENPINWTKDSFPRILDYSSSEFLSEKNDIDLISQSALYISSGGGPESIAIASRREMIRFNQTPIINEVGYPFGVYLPKLIRDISSEEIISIREAIELGLATNWTPNYEKFNLYVEENSETDILNAFKDYLNFKNKTFNKEEKLIIKKYNILRKENEEKGLIIRGINNFIAPSFLLKYPEILI